MTTLNPEIKLPDAGITMVHRTDGSSTTFNFTDYLAKIDLARKAKVGMDSSLVSAPDFLLQGR